eukprot:9794819-Alexandrium_andersonii.AAC.1
MAAAQGPRPAHQTHRQPTGPQRWARAATDRRGEAAPTGGGAPPAQGAARAARPTRSARGAALRLVHARQ